MQSKAEEGLTIGKPRIVKMKQQQGHASLPSHPIESPLSPHIVLHERNAAKPESPSPALLYHTET